MRSASKILIRLVAITVTVTLVILVSNFILLSLGTASLQEEGDPYGLLKQTAAGLTFRDGAFFLTDEAKTDLAKYQAWAMLIDDSGQVVWSNNLPETLLRPYGASDLNAFSSHLLQNHPIYSGRQETGLLVVGYPPQSYSSAPLSAALTALGITKNRMPEIILLNILLTTLLALLSYQGLQSGIRKLSGGIRDLAAGKAVSLPEKGPFKEMFTDVNHISSRMQKKETAYTQSRARLNWLSGIAHDIGTPLKTIIKNASWLTASHNLPATEKQKAVAIRQEGLKLQDMLNDFDLISQMEYDMRPLKNKILRPAALVRQAASELLDSGLEEKFTLRLDIQNEHITINGDEELLVRAIKNLAVNSIIHNPQGCQILLRTSFDVEQNVCRITVDDNGKGLTKGDLIALLELPDQEGKLRPAADGQGLGIIMVGKIAKAHGGQLVLSGKESAGLRADIELAPAQ